MRGEGRPTEGVGDDPEQPVQCRRRPTRPRVPLVAANARVGSASACSSACASSRINVCAQWLRAAPAASRIALPVGRKGLTRGRFDGTDGPTWLGGAVWQAGSRRARFGGETRSALGLGERAIHDDRSLPQPHVAARARLIWANELSTRGLTPAFQVTWMIAHSGGYAVCPGRTVAQRTPRPTVRTLAAIGRAWAGEEGWTTRPGAGAPARAWRPPARPAPYGPWRRCPTWCVGPQAGWG